MNISLSLGQARTRSLISLQCYNSTTKEEDDPYLYSLENRNAPFWLNTEKNKFTVIGCNTLAYLSLDNSTNYAVGCLSSCDSLDTLINSGSCSGIGCCQTAIPKGKSTIEVRFDERYNHSRVYNFSRCSFAKVVEAEFKFNTTYVTTDELSNSNATLPMVVNWVIGNTT